METLATSPKSTGWQFTSLVEFGVRAVPALLFAAEDHRDDFDSETVTTVMENFYANDC